MPTLLQADLPATRTYARRGWLFLASEDGTVTNPRDPSHAVPAAGRLVIACTRQTRKAVACEVDEYAVQPVPTGTRSQVAYLLAKLAAPAEPADVYEVSGGVNGRRCTCPAGATGRPCKHGDAVAAVIAAGGLPGPKK